MSSEQIPTDFHYFPVQASTVAPHVDALYLSMVALSAFFCIAIPAAIIYFSIKYRRRPGNDEARYVETSTALEMTWTIIPFFIVIGMFFWGSRVYFLQTAEDPNAMEILVTGKKWMWKYQHKNGRREIQDLHIPVNTPIRLKMASEDVLHSVFIPAFRLKQDVMPGRYTYLHFEANRPGVYHLFCNQYCGTSHSQMIGKVVVMEQADYQKWLGGYTGDPPEKVGEALFSSLACNTCHSGTSAARGPILNGIYGTKVGLEGGAIVTVDDDYLRESILQPNAKIVLGYQPIMPSFQGVASPEQVNALLAYIKSLPSSGDKVPDAAEGAVDTSAEAAPEATTDPAPQEQPAPAAPAPEAAAPEAAAPQPAEEQEPAQETDDSLAPEPVTESNDAATTAGETAPPDNGAAAATDAQQGVL